MVEKAYEIIDFIEQSKLKKELEMIKEEIKNDKTCIFLIKEFNEAKEMYQKYNYKEDYLNYKKKLMENKKIKKYLSIQNDITLLSFKINKYLKEITGSVTCN